jgi:hypothetical protein
MFINPHSAIPNLQSYVGGIDEKQALKLYPADGRACHVGVNFYNDH